MCGTITHNKMTEAFVYLWYDAPNKMYYLGKHKGSPEDSYTHSSTIWESFTKDNIPEGVTRRILAYGTDEEMCILEYELLVNRKKRCWNRYYNNSLGDPRYVDLSGENHPMWKGGITYDIKAYMKEYHKKYSETIMNNLVELTKESHMVGISVVTNFFDNAIQITQKLRNNYDFPILWGGIHQ